MFMDLCVLGVIFPMSIFGGVCIEVDVLRAEATAEVSQRLVKNESGVLPCAR